MVILAIAFGEFEFTRIFFFLIYYGNFNLNFPAFSLTFEFRSKSAVKFKFPESSGEYYHFLLFLCFRKNLPLIL